MIKKNSWDAVPLEIICLKVYSRGTFCACDDSEDSGEIMTGVPLKVNNSSKKAVWKTCCAHLVESSPSTKSVYEGVIEVPGLPEF